VKHQMTARVLAALVAMGGIAAATPAVNAQPSPGGAPGSPAPSIPGPPGGPGIVGRMPADEADFVRMLDGANTSELDMAKYVVNRTKDAAVHQFAQRMIEDHSSAAVKLEAATRGTNLQPAPRGGATRDGASALALLQAKTGTQLDNDFMRMQVPGHRRVLALLQWESQNGANANLKALATSMTPTVGQHLQMAQAHLASHNLTPYSPPDVLPVPGNVNPNDRGPGTGGASSPAPAASGSPSPRK
jgi:putative membrane protein